MSFEDSFGRLQTAIEDHGTLRRRDEIMADLPGEGPIERAVLYQVLSREQEVETTFQGVELLGNVSVDVAMARPGTKGFDPLGKHIWRVTSDLSFDTPADNPWKLEAGRHMLRGRRTMAEDAPGIIDEVTSYSLWEAQQRERRLDAMRTDFLHRARWLHNTTDDAEVARLNQIFNDSPDEIRRAPRMPRQTPSVSPVAIGRLTPGGVILDFDDPRVTIVQKDIEQSFMAAAEPDVSDATALLSPPPRLNWSDATTSGCSGRRSAKRWIGCSPDKVE